MRWHTQTLFTRKHWGTCERAVCWRCLRLRGVGRVFLRRARPRAACRGAAEGNEVKARQHHGALLPGFFGAKSLFPERLFSLTRLLMERWDGSRFHRLHLQGEDALSREAAAHTPGSQPSNSPRSHTCLLGCPPRLPVPVHGQALRPRLLQKRLLCVPRSSHG